jgi:putative ABC transport system permease protein
MFQDARFALRLFARRPGVTALLVATLSIGIAASTVVFSVADAILWHPLPFREPGRLVGIWSYNTAQKSRTRSVPLAALNAWDTKADIFETVHAYGLGAMLLTGDGDAQGVTGGDASLGLFAALGVYPQSGRDFVAGDYRPESTPVVVLSDMLWRSRFGAAPDSVGRTIAIDGRRHTIVGVMPPGFGFPVDSVRLWVPLTADASRPARVNAIGRLRPGVSFAQAQATAEATTHGLVDGAGRALPELRVTAFMRRDPKTTNAIVALFGAVGLLLLIAVVNAANIQLAEAIRRDAEMSVRASLGASVGRLARQVVTETLLLTTGAAAIGVAISFGALRAVVAALPWMLTFQSLRPIAIDWRALLFASVTAVLVGVGTALTPIARVRRASVQSSLKGTAIAATSHGRLRSTRVAMQLAVTTVLLVAGALLANGFVRMNRADVGFSPAPLLTLAIDLPPTVLRTERAKAEFLDEWRRRAERLPGVVAATVSGGAIPPSLSYDFGAIETADRGVVTGATTIVAVSEIDGGFFPTLGIPLLAGRTFDDGDRAGGTPVAIISRALAERLWPSGDALGRQFRIDRDGAWHMVIGIVGNVGNGGFEQPLGDLAAYRARAQAKNLWRFETLTVRTTGHPARVERPLRELTRALNPDVPVSDVETGDQFIAGANARVRFATFLMWALASMATALAVIGVYGAFWCSVRQRTREIGVRLALGAEPSAIVGMVLGETVLVALIGLAIGLPIAVACSRVLRGLLFGVEPTDPLTFATASVLLVASALVAGYLPARRAGCIDPTEALRHE